MLEPEEIQKRAIILREILVEYSDTDPIVKNCLRTLEPLLAKAVQRQVAEPVFRVPCKYEFIELLGRYHHLRDAFLQFVHYAEDSESGQNPRIRDR